MLEADLERTDPDKSKGYFDEIGYDPDKITKHKSQQSQDSVERKSTRKRPHIKKKRSKFTLRPAVLTIGIILILISTIFAFLSPTTPEETSLADKDEYRLFRAVITSNDINYEYGPGSMYFDAGKLTALEGSTLKNKLVQQDNDFLDYQFVIEVIDVSRYPIHYNRTISEGSAIGTSSIPSNDYAENVVTFETAVNIYVDSDEIHTARFIIHIWK